MNTYNRDRQLACIVLQYYDNISSNSHYTTQLRTAVVSASNRNRGTLFIHALIFGGFASSQVCSRPGATTDRVLHLILAAVTCHPKYSQLIIIFIDDDKSWTAPFCCSLSHSRHLEWHVARSAVNRHIVDHLE